MRRFTYLRWLQRANEWNAAQREAIHQMHRCTFTHSGIAACKRLARWSQRGERCFVWQPAWATVSTPARHVDAPLVRFDVPKYDTLLQPVGAGEGVDDTVPEARPLVGGPHVCEVHVRVHRQLQNSKRKSVHREVRMTRRANRLGSAEAHSKRRGANATVFGVEHGSTCCPASKCRQPPSHSPRGASPRLPR